MTRTPTPEEPMTIGELRKLDLKDDQPVYLVVGGRREPLLSVRTGQMPVWGATYVEMTDEEQS